MPAPWHKGLMAWKWRKCANPRAWNMAMNSARLGGRCRFHPGKQGAQATILCMTESASSLARQLLIALPALDDPNFSRTVSLICQHDEHGAMGIVINRASEYSVGELFAQIRIEGGAPELLAQPVLAGGPVHAERGFVLHDGEREWDSSVRLPGGLALTTSRDVLEAMARGDGPAQAVVALGCAGWGAGQLEQEISENSWLLAPSDDDLLFRLPLEQRWQAAAGLVGVNLMNMTHYSGRA